jgi:PHD/YefM family antitoxin component YafN of YafNO toxin-antitoxin module
MKNTYSVAKAQANFTRILKEAEKYPIGITRHDETVAFILSRERMDAIVETLEVMANPDAMKAIREHKAGKTKFAPLSVLDED